MDVGNPGYQAQWLSNVWSEVRSGGWDGVFMDDTNTDMSWHLGGQTMAKYPTASAWRAATRSMLATVGARAEVGRLPRDPEHRRALDRRLRRPGDVERLDPVHLRRRAGALLEVGLGRAPAGSPAATGRTAAVPDADRAGRQDLPRASRTRRTPDARDRWPGPAPTSCSSTSRPTAARSIFEFSDPEAQDPYAPAWTSDVGTPVGRALPGRLGLAAELHRRHRARQPDRLDGDGRARAGVPSRRRLLDDLGHARARRAARSCARPPVRSSTASRGAAAATGTRGDADPERLGQRDEGLAPLDGAERVARGHLPQRRPQGDRRQQWLLQGQPQAQAEGHLLLQGLRRRHLDLHDDDRRDASALAPRRRHAVGRAVFHVARLGGRSAAAGGVYPPAGGRARPAARSPGPARSAARSRHARPSRARGERPESASSSRRRRPGPGPLEHDHAVRRRDPLGAGRRRDDRHAARHRLEHLHLHPAAAPEREEQQRETPEEVARRLDLAESPPRARRSVPRPATTSRASGRSLRRSGQTSCEERRGSPRRSAARRPCRSARPSAGRRAARGGRGTGSSESGARTTSARGAAARSASATSGELATR